MPQLRWYPARSPGHPVRFGLRRADPGDDLVPVRVAGRGAGDGVGTADAGGVGEEMADGDGVLAVGGELGQVVGDAVVEAQVAALPLLRDRHRDARLGHRPPDDHRLGGHGHAGAGVPDAEVGDRGAVDRDVQLGAEVQPALDARRRARQRLPAPPPHPSRRSPPRPSAVTLVGCSSSRACGGP